MSAAKELRHLRHAVRTAVYWLGCIRGAPEDFCGDEECIRCCLKRALGSAYRHLDRARHPKKAGKG